MARQIRSNSSPRTTVSDKREAILRAAITVFARNGYFNSKVSDIASEAGIADGTVYLYFKSKEEVLHSVFNRAMEEFISEGKRELASIQNAKDKLRRIAQLHLQKLGADRDAAIVFQVELRGSTKFMEEFSASGFAEYLNIIRETIGKDKNRRFSTGFKCHYLRQDSMEHSMRWLQIGYYPKMIGTRTLADTVLEIFLEEFAKMRGMVRQKVT